MAGKSSVTEVVGARLPHELVAWIDGQPGSRTDIVDRALRFYRENVNALSDVVPMVETVRTVDAEELNELARAKNRANRKGTKK